MHDIVEKYSVNSDGFYYQATPDLGFVPRCVQCPLNRQRLLT